MLSVLLLLCGRDFSNHSTAGSGFHWANPTRSHVQINEAAGLTSLQSDEKTTAAVHTLPWGQKGIPGPAASWETPGLNPLLSKGGRGVRATQQNSCTLKTL